MKRVGGASPWLALFTLGVLAVGWKFVRRTDVLSRPRFDGPPGTNTARLVEEVEVGCGDDDTRRNATEQWNDRPHVSLVIAVPSVRPDRREAIRDTWLKWGDDRVALHFFTEPPNEAFHENHQEIAAQLEEESLTYGDITVLDIGTGMNFGVKLLEAMRWMSDHYSFDFFLRLDDDYFLCLERLLDELSCLLESDTQQPPFYAGSFLEPVPFADEAYMLLSSVVVERIVAACNLYCTGFGTLTAAYWMRIGGVGNPQGDVAWVEDTRLEWFGRWWELNPDIPVCEQMMGVHKTYPAKIREQWELHSSKMNASQSTADGCEDAFRYEDSGVRPPSGSENEELLLKRIGRDDLQPCHSYKPRSSKMWCGSEGC